MAVMRTYIVLGLAGSWHRCRNESITKKSNILCSDYRIIHFNLLQKFYRNYILAMVHLIQTLDGVVEFLPQLLSCQLEWVEQEFQIHCICSVLITSLTLHTSDALRNTNTGVFPVEVTQVTKHPAGWQLQRMFSFNTRTLKILVREEPGGLMRISRKLVESMSLPNVQDKGTIPKKRRNLINVI